MASVGPYGNANYGQGGYGGGGYGQPSYGGMPVMTQPMPATAIVTAGGMHRGMGGGEMGDNPKWQIGLCDCCNTCSTCALVFFCTPIAQCIAANKINENCCYPFFCPGGIVAVSTRFRTLHRIEMGMCEEACLWNFCHWCMLCRLLNEMRIRGYD